MMKTHNLTIITTKNLSTNSIKEEEEKIISTTITTIINLIMVIIKDPSNKQMKMKLLLMESQERLMLTIKVTINLRKILEISEIIKMDKKKTEILRCKMDLKEYLKEESQISQTRVKPEEDLKFKKLTKMVIIFLTLIFIIIFFIKKVLQ